VRTSVTASPTRGPTFCITRAPGTDPTRYALANADESQPYATLEIPIASDTVTAIAASTWRWTSVTASPSMATSVRAQARSRDTPRARMSESASNV
jgi:hypothetical protein